MWRKCLLRQAVTRARDGSKEKEEKDGGSDGKEPVSLYKNTKLMLCAETYCSWMVVTVWKIREWERDGHGRAVKYSGMKIPSLREKRWVCGSPQMCSLDGNGRGLELQESVKECRPAGRGINLSLHSSSFYFSSYSTSLFIFQPHSLPPSSLSFHCFVLLERERENEVE